MKQFKMWYKKQKPTQYEQPSCSDAWKAALEWVLSNSTRSKAVSGVFLSVLDMIKIEEELEE